MTPLVSPAHDDVSWLARHRIAVWRTVFLGLAALAVLGTPAWSDHWLSTVLRLGGIALVSLAAFGRMWCALYISGRKARELVTVGPYSLCRHPLYLFNLMGFSGLALLTESLVMGALCLVLFAVLYPAVIASEDRLLQQRFPAFDAYRRQTAALLPRWRNYHSPVHWTVDVPAFARNLGDSVWFPLLAVVVECVDVAHDARWIQGLFVLY